MNDRYGSCVAVMGALRRRWTQMTVVLITLAWVCSRLMVVPRQLSNQTQAAHGFCNELRMRFCINIYVYESIAVALSFQLFLITFMLVQLVSRGSEQENRFPLIVHVGGNKCNKRE